MWKAIRFVAVLAATGCAAHHVPDRIISTDWSAVRALSPATDVAVRVDGDEVRYGRITDVTDRTVEIRERHGAARIARARVASVATRIQIGTSRGTSIVKTAIGSAAVAGVLGALVAAMGENGLTRDDGIAVFAVGTLLGTAAGAARHPAPKYEEKLVYIRP